MWQKWTFLLLAACLASLSPRDASATMIVTHDYGAIDFNEHRTAHYEVALLKLALDKTVDHYGDYALVGLNKGFMTHKRAITLLAANTVDGYVKALGHSAITQEQARLSAVRFPIYLGILGYRVCFTSDVLAESVNAVESLADLKQFTQATGMGWSDADILRTNGMPVDEIANVEAIYRMLSAGRVDVYCRGANEALFESQKYVNTSLTLNHSWAMYYPNPHFFYVNAENIHLKARLEQGLQTAFHDGSLTQLWYAFFGDSLQFADLYNRRIIVLNNAFAAQIPFDYRQYFLQLSRHRDSP